MGIFNIFNLKIYFNLRYKDTAYKISNKILKNVKDVYANPYYS